MARAKRHINPGYSFYKALFKGENEDIDLENTYRWDVNFE